MATASEFRICPDTGLKFHRPAEALMKINAVVGIVFLAIGGVLGLFVALTRWQQVHLVPADIYYMILTGHGINILIFWIIFFEIAVLYFCCTTLLNSRLAAPKWAWTGFLLMVVGSVMNNVAIWGGNSSVMMTSYAPMEAEPHFYLGLILFAVGALIGCFVFLGTLVIAKEENTYEGSLPLVAFGALVACIIAIFTIACGAIILIPTLLWKIGYINHIDALMYRIIWWGLGHSSQQINVSAHISIWYGGAAILFGAKALSEKVSRLAFLMYIAFLQLASAHHLLVDPGVSSEYKIFNTSYAMYLAVMASMIHGLTVPGCIEAAQRKRGFNNGLFEWLTKAPWGHPAFSSIFISIVGFGFLGGITGVVMGVEQIALIIHNTLYVPGHFHGTVAMGTTMAFMGLTYWLIPVLFRREVAFAGMAKWQPYIFGVGLAGISVFMMGAGTLGVSRRHWDMAFAGAAMPYDYPATAYTLMALNGVAGVLAVIGGGMFVLIAVVSVFFGKKKGENETFEGGPLLAEPVSDYHGIGVGKVGIPGTLLLAMVFLVSFILYYYVNWKYLAQTWYLS